MAFSGIYITHPGVQKASIFELLATENLMDGFQSSLNHICKVTAWNIVKISSAPKGYYFGRCGHNLFISLHNNVWGDNMSSVERSSIDWLGKTIKEYHPTLKALPSFGWITYYSITEYEVNQGHIKYKINNKNNFEITVKYTTKECNLNFFRRL